MKSVFVFLILFIIISSTFCLKAKSKMNTEKDKANSKDPFKIIGIAELNPKQLLEEIENESKGNKDQITELSSIEDLPEFLKNSKLSDDEVIEVLSRFLLQDETTLKQYGAIYDKTGHDGIGNSPAELPDTYLERVIARAKSSAALFCKYRLKISSCQFLGIEKSFDEKVDKWEILKVLVSNPERNENVLIKVCLPIDESIVALCSDKDEPCYLRADYAEKIRKSNEEYLTQIRSHYFLNRVGVNKKKKIRPSPPIEQAIPNNNVSGFQGAVNMSNFPGNLIQNGNLNQMQLNNLQINNSQPNQIPLISNQNNFALNQLASKINLDGKIPNQIQAQIQALPQANLTFGNGGLLNNNINQPISNTVLNANSNNTPKYNFKQVYQDQPTASLKNPDYANLSRAQLVELVSTLKTQLDSISNQVQGSQVQPQQQAQIQSQIRNNQTMNNFNQSRVPNNQNYISYPFLKDGPLPTKLGEDYEFQSHPQIDPTLAGEKMTPEDINNYNMIMKQNQQSNMQTNNQNSMNNNVANPYANQNSINQLSSYQNQNLIQNQLPMQNVSNNMNIGGASQYNNMNQGNNMNNMNNMMPANELQQQQQQMNKNMYNQNQYQAQQQFNQNQNPNLNVGQLPNNQGSFGAGGQQITFK